jgi:hypothetical protein
LVWFGERWNGKRLLGAGNIKSGSKPQRKERVEHKKTCIRDGRCGKTSEMRMREQKRKEEKRFEKEKEKRRRDSVRH